MIFRALRFAGTASDPPYEVVSFNPKTGAVLTSQNSTSAIFWGLAPVVTPLPATLPLFLTGFTALELMGWKRKKAV